MSDNDNIGTLLATILGLLVFLTALAAVNWWLARQWPLWLFAVFQVGSGIGTEMVKRGARAHKLNRAKVRAAEALLARARVRRP